MHTKKISNVKTNRTIHPRRQQMFALTHAEVDLIVLTRDLLSAGQTASLSLWLGTDLMIPRYFSAPVLG